MPDVIHEVVIFKLRPGVTREAFLEATAPTQVWLRQQPGMLERTLLEPAAGGDTWVDTARWRSIGEARAAGAAFEKEFANCDFERMLDPATVQMLHLAAVPIEAATPT